MTANGKITTSEIAKRRTGTVRILVTDDHLGGPATNPNGSGPWYPTPRKRGMVTATVTGVTAATGNRRTRYSLTTDRGEVNDLSPSQTFWLAPNDSPAPPAAPVSMHRTRLSIGTQIAEAASELRLTLSTRSAPDGGFRYVISGREMTPGEAADHLLAGGFSEAFGRAQTIINPDRLAESLVEPTDSTSAGVTFEQQFSTDGGKTWGTVAVGLDAADIASARERDASGEGVCWRALPESAAGTGWGALLADGSGT